MSIRYAVIALTVLSQTSQAFAVAPRSAEIETEIQMDVSEVQVEASARYECSMNVRELSGWRRGRTVEDKNVIAKNPFEAVQNFARSANVTGNRAVIEGKEVVVTSKVKCTLKR